MSPSLPLGTRNTATAKRYAVATHVNMTASICSSFPMTGSATFMDEPMKGVMNELSVAITSADFLVCSVSIGIKVQVVSDYLK